jgi:peptide/nickel transport system substrate-binding protein
MTDPPAGGPAGRPASPTPDRRRRRRPSTGRITWILAVGAAVVALASELTAPSAHAGTPAAGGPVLAPVNGGTVTVDVPAVPTTLNAHTPDGDSPATLDLTALVWPQVYTMSPQLVPQLNTDLVQASVQSVSPLTVVYQINPRAVWSDGVPISSLDFAYAWRSQRGGGVDTNGLPDQVASTNGYRDIASVVGSDDDRTVTVVFRTPFADWPSLFDNLLPAHVAQAVGWNTGFNHFSPSALVSGGPWQVASWNPGRSLVLTRNPRWWGTAPHLDRIVVRAVPDARAAIRDVVSGRAQVAEPASYGAGDLALASSDPHVMSQTDLGATMLQLEMNTRQVPLTQVGVRQALGHEIDRDGLVQSLVAPLMRTTWEDNNHLAPNLEGSAYGDDSGTYHAPDPTTAAALLTGAGLKTDARGTWEWQGSPLTLHLVWATDNPWSSVVAPALVGQLVSAGFDVSADPVPSTAALDVALAAGRFDLALVEIPAAPFPSQTQAAFSTMASAGSSSLWRDWSGYDSPAVDTLYATASRQLNAARAQAVYQQIDQDLWTDMPSVPLFAEPQLLVDSVDLSGAGDDAGAGLLWDVDAWSYLRPAPPGSAAAGSSSLRTMRTAR